MLILRTKKEDFLEGQFAKKQTFLEGQFAYLLIKEGRLPGGPVCLSWRPRMRTSWRASLLMLGTKKEDFLECQVADPGAKKEGFLEGQFAWTKKEDFLEGQFAYAEDKESGLKKEDFLQGQFAYPGPGG